MALWLKYFFTVYILCLTILTIQAQTLDFEDQPINEVFQKIEQKINLTFNFDPNLLADYTYTGSLTFNNDTENTIDNTLTKLLYNTPFEFEINQGKILIVLSDKKTYTFCGYIKDKNHKTPLSYTNIFAKNLNIGTQSDDNGYFELTVECYKNQEIEFSYIGYDSQSYSIQELVSTDCKPIFLGENPDLLGLNIVVRDYLIRGISEGKEYGALHLDYATLSQNYINQEQDVLKIIQHLPGITSIDESASRLNIRGSAPDHNLVLWENAPLYDPGHFFGMISAINPYIVDNINIFKTSFAPKYGNTIGGIVDISLDNNISNKFHGGIGCNLTEAHSYFQMPLIKNKMSLTLSLRNSISSLFTSPTLFNYADKVFQSSIFIGEGEENDESEEIEEAEAEITFYDWNGKILFRPNDKIFIKSSFLQTHNYFEYESAFETDNLQKEDLVNFDSYALSSECNIQWNSQNTLTLHHILSNYKNRYFSSLYDEIGEDDEESINELNDTNNGINDHQIGISNNWKFNTKWDSDFNLGYLFEQKTVNYDIESFSLHEFDYTDGEDMTGTFHNINSSLGLQTTNISLNVGMRSTYYSELESWFNSPRINLQYIPQIPNNYLKLKFSAGRFYQFISQLADLEGNELNIDNNLWILTRSNSEEVLTADKLSGGFVYKRNKWLIDIEAYYHKNKGLSGLSSSSSTNIDTDFIGESNIKGIDFLINKHWENYRFWVNYTLSKNDYLFSQIQESKFAANNDHRHNLSIVNNFIWKKWQASLTYNYRSGLPYSIPSGTTFYEEEGEEEGYYEFSFDQRNNHRLKSYNRIDFGIAYKTSLFKDKTNLEFNLSLLNVLNTKNISARDYYLGDFKTAEGLETIQIDKYLLSRTPQMLVRFYW